MPASPPATRWSAWPTCHSSLEPAGHGQSSAPLGPTPLLLQPLTAPCLSATTPISAPQPLGLLPSVPSYTSASTTSLGFRSLLAFIHLRDPSLCASVPRFLGASCLRVSVPQGPLGSGTPGCTASAVPLQPLSGPPTSSGLALQGHLRRLPSCPSLDLSWGPSFHCGEGQRTPEGPPCPRELMQIQLLPGGEWEHQSSVTDGMRPQPGQGAPQALQTPWQRGEAGCGARVLEQVRAEDAGQWRLSPTPPAP